MRSNTTAKLAEAACYVALAMVLASVLAARTFPGVTGLDEYVVTALPADGRAVAANGGQLDLGPISYQDPESRRHGAGRNGSFSVQRYFRLRLEHRSGKAGRVALTAALVHGCSSCKVSVDGIPITLAPQIILRKADLNSTTAHRLEIEIPVSAPPGFVDAEIRWQVDEI
jgi:hypothetical protein